VAAAVGLYLMGQQERRGAVRACAGGGGTRWPSSLALVMGGLPERHSARHVRGVDPDRPHWPRSLVPRGATRSHPRHCLHPIGRATISIWPEAGFECRRSAAAGPWRQARQQPKPCGQVAVSRARCPGGCRDRPKAGHWLSPRWHGAGGGRDRFAHRTVRDGSHGRCSGDDRSGGHVEGSICVALISARPRAAAVQTVARTGWLEGMVARRGPG